MISRRQFLKLSVASTAAAFVASRERFLGSLQGVQSVQAAQSPQVPIPGSTIPQFVDPVPNLLAPEGLIVDAGGTITLEMREHLTQVLPTGMPKTYVWSYLQPDQATRTSFLGPVIVAARNQPTEVKAVNLLGDSTATNIPAYKYGTDQTLHWADPLNDEMNMWNHMSMPPEFGSEGAQNYAGSIPAVIHLHGGEVPPEVDGGPDAWMTSDGQHVGHGFYSKNWDGQPQNFNIYRYPNAQQGGLIWFHDHTLGATRLNVFCGLAGGYLITDPDNDPPNLPELFPLVVQDRSFDTNGQFFMPVDSAGGIQYAPNPEHPYWVPEFVGDVILVNGKTWPYMNVQQKRYTFLFVNGSNARTYEMSLIDPVSKNFGPPLWVVGTDGGYLDKPVKIVPAAKGNNVLPIMPGERYWVIVDFAGYQTGKKGPNGQPYSGNWLLRNNAKAPYPAGAPVQGTTTARMMQFRVGGGAVADASYNPATGAPLRTPMVRLAGTPVQKTRQLTLNEVMTMPQTAINPVTGVLTAYPGGPLEIMVNNTKWDGKRITGVDADGMYMTEPIPGFVSDGVDHNWLSEVPNEGETEIWEFVNLTADAHPMHLHLVQFQLLNRQAFNTTNYAKAYAAAFPGGGYDHMTKAPFPAGMYIPSYGPPLHYFTGNARALGGNPDIVPFLQGAPKPPLPHENGWKDTIIAFPGQVTRILVRWAPAELPANTPVKDAYFPFDPGPKDGGFGYVWHCHIIDHEDNEMMRPDQVNPNPNAVRTYIKGVDY